MSDVVLREISKAFGDVDAVTDLSLTVADGEFVVLLGPTGAGKTTTLRLIAGLETADSGSVWIDGRDVSQDPPPARDVAFVFQQYSLYPHLTVFDNLAFPLRSPARKMPEREVSNQVRGIADLLHIEHKLENKATQLSGGEMQRVAIGRALVRRPSIYLMDEPLSSLDAKLRAELRLELKRIQKDLGATILYVTHDQTEAMTMADRIGVVQEGRLVQIATPREIYEQPRNTYVAARLGQPAINLFPRELLPVDRMPAAAKTIGARTEHVSLSPAANGDGAGRVEWIEHLGDQNHLHVTVGDEKLVTLVDPRSRLAVGDNVAIDLVNPLFFDAAGERVADGSGGG